MRICHIEVRLHKFKISDSIIVQLNYFNIYVFYDCYAMKFVNKVGFLLVLVVSLHDSIHCAAGQGNPQGFGKDHQNDNPNRVFNDSVMPEKKKGEKPSDHEINQKHITTINNLLAKSTFSTPSRSHNIESFSTPDVMCMNSLGSTDLARLGKVWSQMKLTPNRSKEDILNRIIMKNRKYVTRDKGNPVTQNDKLLRAYEKGSPVIKFMNNNRSLIFDEIISSASAVDLSHVMNPKFEKDENGQFVKVTGGHVLKCYKIKKLRSWDIKGFVGSDENIISISFSGKIGKTLYKNVSPEKIVSNAQQRSVIAIGSDDMNVSQITPGKFVGSYSSKGDPFLLKTQFPILTVSDAILDQNKQLLVGYFVKFQGRGGVKPKSKKPLFINQSEFNLMMDNSSLMAFSQVDKGFIVKDITQSLKKM